MKTPREVAAEWFQRLWNDRDESVLVDLLAPDARAYLEGGQLVIGPEGVRGFFRTLISVFPDLRVEVQDILGDDERACVRWQAQGTHRGEGMGLAPSNRVCQFHGATWLHVRDGQIVEGSDHWNQGALLAQLAS